MMISCPRRSSPISSRRFLSVAAHLMRLELRDCVVPGKATYGGASDEALQHLAAAAAKVCHLSLENVLVKKTPPRSFMPLYGQVDFPASWLLALPHLTHLSLANVWPEDVMSQFKELADLKELRLVDMIEVPEDAVEVVEAISSLKCLTLLNLENRAVWITGRRRSVSTSAPGLLALTNLRHLRLCFAHGHEEAPCDLWHSRLEAAKVDLGMLNKLPQLQFLNVSGEPGLGSSIM